MRPVTARHTTEWIAGLPSLNRDGGPVFVYKDKREGEHHEGF